MAKPLAHTYINAHGVYYFQLRLPKDIGCLRLEERYNLPSVIRRSLGTRYRAEAAKKVTRLLGEHLELFDRIRASRQLAESSITLLKNLTLSEAEAIALKYREATEQIAEALSSNGTTVPHQDESWAVSIDASGARELAIKHGINQANSMDGFLQQKDIKLVDQPSQELASAVVNKTLSTMLTEDRSTAVIERARAREAPLPVSNQTPLQSLLAALIKVKMPAKAREAAYKAAVDCYERHLNRPAMLPEDFDKEQLQEYKQAALAKGMKVSTWNSNHAAILNMLIRMAYEEDIIRKPFKISVTADEEKAVRKQNGLPLHDRSTEGRRAASDTEIKTMRELPVVKDNPEFFEFLLCTGMRSAEAAQIKPGDVIEDAEHGLFVRVTDTEGRSVKNQSSVRTVPIPSGALTEFVRHQMAQGHKYIFDDLEKGRPTKGRGVFHRSPKTAAERAQTPARRVEWFRKEFSVQKREAGIDNRVTLHSLRHTWKLKARSAGIQESISDYITGHSNKSNQVAMDYGQGFDTVYNRLREASDVVLEEMAETDQTTKP